MPDRRIAYFAHSIRSDWNNGNAHFLRGLLRAMGSLGHRVQVFEPVTEWSHENLLAEDHGRESVEQFAKMYADLHLETYAAEDAGASSDDRWIERLRGIEVVVLHEWNPAALAHVLLRIRDVLHFKLVFHDTHHRASSSPDSFAAFGLEQFDGVLAFGEALRRVYVERFSLERVWTLHEAADTTVFKAILDQPSEQEVVWIGNWGEGERADEIREFLVQPCADLEARCKVFGVRYPKEALRELGQAGIAYGGYVPNLDAPLVYARSRLTLHIPRQQYAAALTGIPTIRVFEALACGIPLISAPWQDVEELFRPGDLRFVADGRAMRAAMEDLLRNPSKALDQAHRGLETILARHTCVHRAQQLSGIVEELLS